MTTKKSRRFLKTTFYYIFDTKTIETRSRRRLISAKYGTFWKTDCEKINTFLPVRLTAESLCMRRCRVIIVSTTWTRRLQQWATTYRTRARARTMSKRVFRTRYRGSDRKTNKKPLARPRDRFGRNAIFRARPPVIKRDFSRKYTSSRRQ